ncbi:hypothetical protein CNR22_24220 [Sphingobacteriaceae bacterium]|nr:hypothetical protein CNR22_24220 [Sphingobacteriaceae bacterium]
MKIKVYICLVVFLSMGASFAQQQTLYTSYLMNQYIYNPAYAGVEDGTQFNLGYRNQYVGFDGAPKSYMFSGYGKFKKKPNMAAGGLIMTEKIGLLQRTSFYATYSYHLKINKKAAINFGLGAGGIQYKVRVYDARPYDKDDNFLSNDVLRAWSFDANAGFYFYTKNFFLGFSDQQMPATKIRWDNTNGKNTTHFYAYTGYSIHFNKEWVLQPSVLVRSASPAPYQIEYNAKVIYDEMFWGGFSYRQNSSACFLFGCKIDKRYSFGYSYDMTITALNKYSSGSHEIVLSYLIPFKRKKSKSELVKDADEEELNKIDNSLKTNLKNKKKKEEEKKQEEEKKETPVETPGVTPSDTPSTPPGETQPGSENKTETPNLETPNTISQPETNSGTEPQKPVETVSPAVETAQPVITPEVEPKKEEPKN